MNNEDGSTLSMDMAGDPNLPLDFRQSVALSRNHDIGQEQLVQAFRLGVEASGMITVNNLPGGCTYDDALRCAKAYAEETRKIIVFVHNMREVTVRPDEGFAEACKGMRAKAESVVDRSC